jgi:hypothetical protein
VRSGVGAFAKSLVSCCCGLAAMSSTADVGVRAGEAPSTWMGVEAAGDLSSRTSQGVLNRGDPGDVIEGAGENSRRLAQDRLPVAA